MFPDKSPSLRYVKSRIAFDKQLYLELEAEKDQIINHNLDIEGVRTEGFDLKRYTDLCIQQKLIEIDASYWKGFWHDKT